MPKSEQSIAYKTPVWITQTFVCVLCDAQLKVFASSNRPIDPNNVTMAIEPHLCDLAQLRDFATSMKDYVLAEALGKIVESRKESDTDDG